MSSSSVWVQLYYKGIDEPQGNPIEITSSPEYVADLIKAVKTELQLDAQLNLIFACLQGTTPPFLQDKAIDPGDDVPPGTTSKSPLIAVAPAPPAPHPPGQEQPLPPLLAEEVIDKIENSVCVLIVEGKTYRSSFAVSNSRVYTTAHQWEEEDDDGATYFAVAVGDKVECIHGKPSANKRYNLQVVKLDEHLDYCILEIIGDHTFTDWMETDTSPNLRLTTPVFLAAHYIIIQKRLDEYEVGVNPGITCGTFVRRGNRHLVHSCASFKRYSGDAIIVMSNGKVIGLHIAAVNEAKELFDLEIGSVADSINQLCDGQSSGSVGLLVSAIEP